MLSSYNKKIHQNTINIPLIGKNIVLYYLLDSWSCIYRIVNIGTVIGYWNLHFWDQVDYAQQTIQNNNSLTSVKSFFLIGFRE